MLKEGYQSERERETYFDVDKDLYDFLLVQANEFIKLKKAKAIISLDEWVSRVLIRPIDGTVYKEPMKEEDYYPPLKWDSIFQLYYTHYGSDIYFSSEQLEDIKAGTHTVYTFKFNV